MNISLGLLLLVQCLSGWYSQLVFFFSVVILGLFTCWAADWVVGSSPVLLVLPPPALLSILGSPVWQGRGPGMATDFTIVSVSCWCSKGLLLVWSPQYTGFYSILTITLLPCIPCTWRHCTLLLALEGNHGWFMPISPCQVQMDDSVTTNERPMFAAALEETLLLNLENQPQRCFFLFTEQSHGKGKIHKVIESLWNHEVQLLE